MDTLAYTKALDEAGVSRDQVRTHATASRDDMLPLLANNPTLNGEGHARRTQ